MQGDDQYIWRATYADGTVIDEYDHEHPDGRGFADVDTHQTVKLELLPSTDHGPSAFLEVYVSEKLTQVDFFMPQSPIHTVIIPRGARPIFFRRRRGEINVATEAEEWHTWHCVGYQRTLRGKNVTVYHFIKDDGASLTTDDYQAV